MTLLQTKFTDLSHIHKSNILNDISNSYFREFINNDTIFIDYRELLNQVGRITAETKIFSDYK